jgi:ADP-ribose pyrophosphatase YjhB (NUDIX family)
MASACVYIECPITGLILGVARRNDPNAFGLPGGKMEETDANEKETAQRELKEETGALILVSRLREIFRRQGGVTFRARVQDVIARQPPKAGEPRVAWVTREQLIDGPFGVYNKRLLEAIDRDECCNSNACDARADTGVCDHTTLERRPVENTCTCSFLNGYHAVRCPVPPGGLR